MKIHKYDEISLIRQNFINLIKIHHLIKVNELDENSPIGFKFINLLKFYLFDENASI